MLKKLLIVFLITITLNSFVRAQVSRHDSLQEVKVIPENETETLQLQNRHEKFYSFSQFGHETLLFATQPLKWKTKDWLTLGGLAGGTALLSFADQPLRDATRENQKYYYSFPVVLGRVYGEWYSIAGVAGTIGTYGLIAHNTAAKKTALELLQAGLYSEVVTAMLKIAIGRARPYTNEGHASFHPFSFFDGDYHSFPSGHTTSAFAMSTVLSRQTNSTGLKILAYTPAAFTLFSRVYQDKHWVSDELLGAAIGYFIGQWVVDLHEEKPRKVNISVTSVYPPAISVDLDSFFQKPQLVTPAQY